MNKIISIIVLAAVLFSVNACNQTNNKQNNQTEKPEKAENYLSVDDVFTQGESLSGKTVHVEGIDNYNDGSSFYVIELGCRGYTCRENNS